jgi:c-di-GMP-binding flagellar brake protein YcgR
MSDDYYIERRQYKRVNVSIPVRYREITSEEIIESGKKQHASECVNISRGGMQLVMDSGREKEDDKLLEAGFVISGRNIKLIAHISWTCFDSNINKFRTGLEFIAIKSGDLEVIGQIA